jgi:multimeric flavodoxin WrbA
MRCLLRIQLDTPASNAAIADGTMSAAMQQMLDRTQPEASYFGTIDGRRTAFIVFDLADPSDIPIVAEPALMKLNAEVNITPIMNLDDLQKGLAQLGAAS